MSAAAEPVDHLTRFGAPDAPALITRERTFTFAELEEEVGRLAAGLLATGLRPGDRVASWLPKTAAACLLPLAAARAGLVHVPVNPLLKPPQVAHILADSGAELLISQPARLAQLAPNAARPLDEAALWDAAAPLISLPPSGGDPARLAALLYTSGSTGRPKGVMVTHANLWWGALSVREATRLKPADRVLAVLPLSFDYGQNQLLSAWAAGAAVCPLDYLTPADLMRAVDRLAATTLAGVPPLWVQLAERDWPAGTGATLTRLTNSGGHLSAALSRRLADLFPQADIYAMYGLTEAFRSTVLPPERLADKPDSVGAAVPHAEVMVVRPDGTEADVGEAGELVHAGPLVAGGYWRDPARTAERFRPAPSWSRFGGTAVWSGDTVRRDAEGHVTFVGRDDATIKTSGNRVSPTEIEEAAVASGLVTEAVAFGVPDERLGQAIRLVVRPDAPDRAETLAAHLRATLANYMQPARIDWVDALPRNPNGKLDRAAVIAASTS